MTIVHHSGPLHLQHRGNNSANINQYQINIPHRTIKTTVVINKNLVIASYLILRIKNISTFQS